MTSYTPKEYSPYERNADGVLSTAEVTVAVDSEAAQSFTDIERRLLRALMNPAMALAFITGIALMIGTGTGAPRTGY